MVGRWPHPGDSPIARSRRIALSYRQLALSFQDALRDAGGTSPNAVEYLDRKFTEWGEGWHAEDLIRHDPEDMISTREAGRVLGISPRGVSHLRRIGRITGEWRGAGKGYWFRFSDVELLSTQVRTRGDWQTRGVTDTIQSHGESAPQ